MANMFIGGDSELSGHSHQLDVENLDDVSVLQKNGNILWV